MGECGRGRHVGSGRAMTDATMATPGMRVESGPDSTGFHACYGCPKGATVRSGTSTSGNAVGPVVVPLPCSL